MRPMITSKRRLTPRPDGAKAFAVGLTRTLGITMLLVSSAPAQWRTSQDPEVCVTGTGVTSLDVAVCSRALARQDMSDLNRASVLTARGRAYRDSGRPAEAIADFDAALAINAYSASAFHERARALEDVGDHRRALEDYGHALALSPHFAAAYKNRGVAHFFLENLDCARIDLAAAAALTPDDPEIHAFRGFVHYLLGQRAEAAEDFRQVALLRLPYPYLPLWRHIVGDGSGAPRRGVLVEAREALLPGEWPLPLLKVYLGELDAETLIATIAADIRFPDSRRRLAASHYYVAALERLNDRPVKARRHLTQSIALSERRMPERVLAKHELTIAGGANDFRPHECAMDSSQ